MNVAVGRQKQIAASEREAAARGDFPETAPEDVAQRIFHEIVRRAEGPLDDTETWVRLIHGYGLDLSAVHGQPSDRGVYVAPAEDRVGRIVYNTNCSPLIQIRVMSHETAENCLVVWYTRLVDDPEMVCNYTVDEPVRLRHKIARRVEDLLIEHIEDKTLGSIAQVDRALSESISEIEKNQPE